MVTQVYLEKRNLRSTRRNGQHKYRWSLRWRDPKTGAFSCESTGTGDRTEAEAIRKAKWAELNIPGAAPEVIDETPTPAASTWQDCRAALQRAMEADNLRPSYVSDALLTLEVFRRMFPEATCPAGVTADTANEYKRRRAEGGASPWTIRGDLATLKAVFGKWLGKECALLDYTVNPFANIKPPRCDDPDIRIVSAAESAELFAWIADRWNGWRLPAVYLEVAALLGWRATEIASLKEDDLLTDGFVRVVGASSKTRHIKHGWLPAELHADVRACVADGWAFGRFADELRRLLLLWKHRPHHAAKVQGFTPDRLVGWLQDELQRFNQEKTKAAEQAGSTWGGFTLHDFRRTAITGLQMAGVSEKEASVMVGATPEVMRKHYEKLDQMAIARRSVERRLVADGKAPATITMHQSLRAGYARGENGAVDKGENVAQTATA